MPHSGKLDFFLSVHTAWAHPAQHLYTQRLLSLEFSLPASPTQWFYLSSWHFWLSLVSSASELLVHDWYICTTSFALPMCTLGCDKKKLFMWICCFPTLWLSWKQGLCLIHLHVFSDLHSLSPRTFWLNQSDRPRSNPWGQLCSGIWAKIPFPASPELLALIHRSLEPRPSAWGRVEKRVWYWWRKDLGASPISSTANWVISCLPKIVLLFCFSNCKMIVVELHRLL